MPATTSERLVVERFGPEHVSAFEALHATAGWCFCVAWWVQTWEGWEKRTAEQNRAVRARLIAEGIFDGYLAFEDGRAVGWCQVLPRDRLVKVAAQFHLAPDPGTWSIGCFYIHPDHRRGGLARALLAHVLEDLPRRGATRVEAYPKRVANPDSGELWNGPEPLFRDAGFVVVENDLIRPVLAKTL